MRASRPTPIPPEPLDPRALVASAEATADCPDDAELAALAEGALEEPRRGRVASHVASCDRCLLALDAGLEELAALGGDAGRAPGPVAPLRFALVLAAAALALVALVPRGGDGSPEAWAPALARLEPLELRITRGDPGDVQDARTLYREGRYARAAAALRALPDPTDEERLLLGSGLLLAGRPAETLAALAPLVEGDGALRPRALWIAAQALLVEDRAEQARALLERLLRSQPGNRPAAEQLDRLTRALRAGR